MKSIDLRRSIANEENAINHTDLATDGRNRIVAGDIGGARMRIQVPTRPKPLTRQTT